MDYLPNAFRIVSWNMQGASGFDRTKGQIKDKLSLLCEYMQDDQVIAICLQECSHLFGWWKGYHELAEFLSEEKMDRIISNREKKQERLSTQYKAIGKEDFLKLDEQWADPILYCYGRCSLGILVRKKYFTHQKVNVLDTRRPILGVRLYGFNRRQPLYLFSVHVPYASGNLDLDYIKDALHYVSSNTLLRYGGEEGNWMCAGDFNYCANKHEKNALEPFIANMRRPGVLTTVRNEYDYCFVGGESLSSRGCSVHVDAFNHSDHRPVHYLFSPCHAISSHASDLASKLAQRSDSKTASTWKLYTNPKN